MELAARKSAFRALQSASLAPYLSKPNSRRIISILGLYGPLSISSIQKKMKTSDHLTSNSDIQLEYTEIEREIEPLTNSGLVKELHYYFHKTETKIIGLTFKGLLWYFRESGKPTHTKDRIDLFFRGYKEPYAYRSKHRKNRFIVESYKELIPFCPLWYKMVRQIGKECLDRLELTVNNFYVGEKTAFSIEPLGLGIETYPNYSGELFDGVFFPSRVRPLVMSYLQSEEALLLREAYVAYLITEDFQKLGNVNETDIKIKLPKLKSVNELASLEKNVNGNVSLFSEKGLLRFSHTYENIEYYFTGMFVFNLLWEKKPVNDYYYDEVYNLFQV